MSRQDQPTAPDRPKPHTQRFRRPADAVTLSPEQQRRQARIMATAWRMLGSRETVMRFFNEWSEPLGGRPLDLATDSEAGFVAVDQALRIAGPLSPVRHVAGAGLPPHDGVEQGQEAPGKTAHPAVADDAHLAVPASLAPGIGRTRG